MDLPNQILLYLLLITAGQGFALSAILGLQTRQHPSFRLLWLFFLLLSLGCLEKSVEGIFFPNPGNELPFPLALPLAYYPAIYLHIWLLSDLKNQFSPKHLLLFIPAAVMDFASFYLIDWGGNPVPSIALTSSQSARGVFDFTYKIAFFAQFIAYTASIQNIRIKLSTNSDISGDPRLHWINRLFPVLLVFWASWVLVNLIGKGNPLGYFSSFLIHGSIIVLIYGLGFQFLLKTRDPLCRLINRQSEPSPSDTSEIIAKVREMKLHREKSLTLPQAAKEIGCSQKALSNAVNTRKYPNFNDYINSLRIEEFKALATNSEYQNLSLFGIAQTVGFASKTSFHRCFKKHCGQTPGEFIAQHSTLPQPA